MATGRVFILESPNPLDLLDFIKVCRVSWPTDLSPSDGGAYAQL